MSMRITNQMITNNSLRNMQKGMSDVNTRTQQMTTGKKISKASEDPVTAIRALKLRTTVNQLEQYKGKNIPDANSWFKITQTSLDNITKRVKDINELCVQGSTDSFATDDRSSIIDSLKQMRSMIYDEGNATYAGRFIFSGYKTDRALAFSDTEDNTKYAYDIKQKFTSDDIDIKNVVGCEVNPNNIDKFIQDEKDKKAIEDRTYQQPDPKGVYRIHLGYENIDNMNDKEEDGVSKDIFAINAVDSDGNAIDLSNYKVRFMETNQANIYYDVDEKDKTTGDVTKYINVIKETGEIVFGVDAYNDIKKAASIEITYAKNNFKSGELRPEHYYDCRQKQILGDGSIKTVDYKVHEEGQPIYYEVNFNQNVQVNTEGKELINNKVGNYIDDCIYALTSLQDAEKTKNRLNAMLNDDQYAKDEDAVAVIKQLIEDIDVEVAVKKENMQKVFSNNIYNFQKYLNLVTSAQSELGSRMSKLEMVETRVKEQFAEFKELKSRNEDVKTDEIIINFNEANLVYESALAATSNIMKKTLLDYI